MLDTPQQTTAAGGFSLLARKRNSKIEAGQPTVTASDEHHPDTSEPTDLQRQKMAPQPIKIFHRIPQNETQLETTCKFTDSLPSLAFTTPETPPKTLQLFPTAARTSYTRMKLHPPISRQTQ